MKSSERQCRVAKSAITLGAAVAIILIGSSCSSSESSSSVTQRLPKKATKQAARSDALVVGDTLEVFVLEDQAFNGTYKVREKGDIIFP